MLTLLGLSLLLLSLALCAAGYLFAAYVMFRVGEKFRVGRYRDYLVPVWNLALLCDCGGVTRRAALRLRRSDAAGRGGARAPSAAFLDNLRRRRALA